jgi:ribonuclease HI
VPSPTDVYTDGACLKNPGPGGWAWAVADGPFASGHATHTTNQRMEITAAYEAVRALDGPIEVVSDSTYVVNCFVQGWWRGWTTKGWLNSKKEPVANRDLWEPFIALVRERGDVTFRWVKGHSGDAMNDAVDRLATTAAKAQSGLSGTRVDLGWIATLDADAPRGSPAGRATAGAASGSGTGSGAPATASLKTLTPATPATATPATGGGGRPTSGPRAVPEGHLVAIVGHRPPELGGYGENPVASSTRERLAEILAAKALLHPDLVVLTGLGLGAEQLGAEAAATAGVPYVAVLPYPQPDAVWPEASRARFRDLLRGAREQAVLQAEAPATKQDAGRALSRRDAWLARHAKEAIVVWDGRDEHVGRLARSFEDHLGDDVWIVEPR